VAWWAIAVLIIGSVLLIYLNWPGETGSRKIWYDTDNTGWYVYRSSGDPIILSSFAAVLASVIARWSGPIALGIVAGCVASVLEDGLLVLVGGISSDESTRLFNIWADETTAWLLTGVVAAVMVAVLLIVLRPRGWQMWPVPPPGAVMVVVGGILLLVHPFVRHPDGFAFIDVTWLAAVEPFVTVALAWLALAATEGRDRIWLTAAAATYAVVSIVAAVPALTEGDSTPAFLITLFGNVLVAAGVLSRGLRLPSSP
jgi:hypothetical protein